MHYPHVNWENCNIQSEAMGSDFHFIQAVQGSYLHQHVSDATRFQGSDRPSLLDLVLTNEEGMDNIEHAAPLGKSDHSIIKITVRCSKQLDTPKTRHCYDKGNYAKMREMLSLNWEEVFRDCMDDPSRQWDKFLAIFTAAQASCIPAKLNKTSKTRYALPLGRKSLGKIKKKKQTLEKILGN